MKLILIAALNTQRVIGRNGKTPWHISEDLQRFKKLTLNHIVLMGRKTFESMRKPLPDRRSIVISRNKSIAFDSVELFPTVVSALSALKNEGTVFVIGGGEIFTQTIDLADELNLTIVENDESGDTFFPPYEHLIGTTFTIDGREQHSGFHYLLLKKR